MCCAILLTLTKSALIDLWPCTDTIRSQINWHRPGSWWLWATEHFEQLCLSLTLGPPKVISKSLLKFRQLPIWFQRRNCFKDLTTYVHGNYLGHVTSIIWTIFFPPDHKGSTGNLTLMCLAAWGMFDSMNLGDIGQSSNNDLDLWYSYVFMYSLSICTNFQFKDFNILCKT